MTAKEMDMFIAAMKIAAVRIATYVNPHTHPVYRAVKHATASSGCATSDARTCSSRGERMLIEFERSLDTANEG